MSGYIEAYVVCEGALEAKRTFPYGEEGALESWARAVIEEAEAEGDEAQVFTLAHDHGMDVEECVCVQYLTDLSPMLSTTI